MKLTLHNQELWQTFREHHTEMVITNTGRRMYPVISISFKDLNPRHYYTVMVDFVPVDKLKYKFDVNSNRWIPTAKRFYERCHRMYTHPETPATGASLMNNVLTFKKLKLTNNIKLTLKDPQVILLNTMHRYIPRVHVIESAGGIYYDWRSKQDFSLPEAEFITVSYYRNKQIAQLKIDANPFASAFRSEGLHGKAKRRRIESKEADFRPRFFEGRWSPTHDEGSTSDDEQASDEHEPGSVESCPSPTQTESQEELQCPPSLICGTTQMLINETNASQPQSSSGNTSVNQSNVNGVLSCGKELMLYCHEKVPEDEVLDAENRGNQDESFLAEKASNGGLTTTQDASTMEGLASEYAVKPNFNRRKRYRPRRVQRSCYTSSPDSSGDRQTSSTRLCTVEDCTLDLQLPQARDVIRKSDDAQRSSSAATPASCQNMLSSCMEPEETPISCNNSVQSQSLGLTEVRPSCQNPSLLIHMQTEEGKTLVTGHQYSLPVSKESGGTRVTCPTPSLPLSQEPAEETVPCENSSTSTCPETSVTSVSCHNALPVTSQDSEGTLLTYNNHPPMTSQESEGTSLTYNNHPPMTSPESEGTSLTYNNHPPMTSQESEGTSLTYNNHPPMTSQESEGTSLTYNNHPPMTSQESEGTLLTYNNHPPLQAGEAIEETSYDCRFSTPTAVGVEEASQESQKTSFSPTGEQLRAFTIGNSVFWCGISDNNTTSVISNSCENDKTKMSASNATRFTANSAEKSEIIQSTDASTSLFPIIVDTFSNNPLFSGFSNGVQMGNQQNAHDDENAMNTRATEPTLVSQKNNKSDDMFEPIILNSFTIGDSHRLYQAGDGYGGFGKLIEAKQQRVCDLRNSLTSGFSQNCQACFTGHSEKAQSVNPGFLDLSSTLPSQPLSLEKFYSFPSLPVQEKPHHERPQARHYKPTRTIFSRLSLEPICSVRQSRDGYLRRLLPHDCTPSSMQRPWSYQV